MCNLFFVLLMLLVLAPTNEAIRDTEDASTGKTRNGRNSYDMVNLLASRNKHVGTKPAESTQMSRRPLEIRRYTEQEVLHRRFSSHEESDSEPYAGQCGMPATTPAVSSFIIGGEDAEAGDWPWQIMLLVYYGYDEFAFTCGGSLINEQWVLTAAHCLYSDDIAQVALGAENQDLSGSHVQIVPVAQILCHEEYLYWSNEHDICLLKLLTPVTFNNYIRPICLPSTGDSVVDGEKCVITGWGETQGTGNNSVLQEVEAEIYPSSNCSDWYGEDHVDILEGHVCAGSVDASAGACYGDSGGPLACNRSDAGEEFYALFGITSFGSPGCQTESRPTVFTRVTSYLDWIENTQANSEDVDTLCYDLSTIHPCGALITTNNTIIRSPVQDNFTWIYPENLDCWWEVEAPEGYALKFDFLCFFSLDGYCGDSLTITPEEERENEYCGYYYYYHDYPVSFQTLTSKKANISFHSDSYGEGLGFVLKVTFVESDIYEGECGIGSEVSTSPFISGGTSVSQKKWPWQAAVLQYNEFYGTYSYRCAGTLINEQWILSSASCFNKNSPSLYTVRLGDSTAQEHYADKLLAVGLIHCHEEYDGTRAENNICLVKLSSNVTFTSFIRPACVPGEEELVGDGVNCTITGYVSWWWYSYLEEAEVDIYKTEECVNSYKDDGIFITEDNFCAGTENDYWTAAPCEGDFGGPLVCKFDGSSSFKVMGVANFAGQYCWDEKPGVFSEVARYSDWIERTISASPDISSCFDPLSIRDCNSSITTDNTVIRSPVTDRETWQYPSYEDCDWSVEAPEGKKIKIEFICFFNTEGTSAAGSCREDYLSIEESDRGARYCGLHDVKDMQNYVTTGNKVKLRFHSNYYYSSQGFVLRISFVNTNDDTLQEDDEEKEARGTTSENWHAVEGIELEDSLLAGKRANSSSDSTISSPTPSSTMNSTLETETDAVNISSMRSSSVANSDNDVATPSISLNGNGEEMTTSSGQQLYDGSMFLLPCLLVTRIVLSI